ncbi:MAG: TM0106 family RecB-like putative nuclease [Pseudomonadota bacterium]
MKITASQLYSHLTCPHRVAMDVNGDPALRDPVSPFVQLLWERGIAHEQDVIAGLGGATDLSALSGDDKETATRAAIERREPLIYSGRLSVDELLGEPDLLRFENGGYVAIDIKSGAGKEGADEDDEEGRPKKTYGVQIALYTDILLRMQVAAGRYGYILDAHLQEHRYDLNQKLGPKSDSLWDIYLKTRAATLALLRGSVRTQPALSTHCKQCVWQSACFEVLQQTQDLTLVAELGRSARDSLQGQFPSLMDLAEADVDLYVSGGRSRIPGVGPRRLRRFQRRAALQVATDSAPYLTNFTAWPVAPVELFFDIETDPMRDLCYLHGFVIREKGVAGERFHAVFAEDLSPAAERDAFADAMALLRQFPDAVVVHYSKYERTQYLKLAHRYPEVATETEIRQLFAAPRALDLYERVRADSEWPTHDYSVKTLAKYCGFDWRDPDPSGASSIEWFDQWAKSADPALRQRLLDYNEDDCRAMRVVLDAMKGFQTRAVMDT